MKIAFVISFKFEFEITISDPVFSGCLLKWAKQDEKRDQNESNAKVELQLGWPHKHNARVCLFTDLQGYTLIQKLVRTQI